MKLIPLHLFSAFFCVVVLTTNAFSQPNQKLVGSIGFYNVENLFDTVDDETINDEDFLPDGDYKWTEERYQAKLKNIAKVIEQMSGGPDIIGLAEVENRKVLEDLVNNTSLKRHRYRIIHFDSPDWRGIDVALLYKEGRFLPFGTNLISMKSESEPDFKTRDMLWVKGLYLGDTLNVVVNHWPSRRGGKQDKRLLAAKILRHAIDSVQQLNAKAKIVLMGDFNDDPINKSMKKVLKADLNKAPGTLYNTSFPTFRKGFGTLNYQGRWNLFDQIIVSQSLLKGANGKYYYKDDSFTIAAAEWMLDKEKGGAPIRTYTRGAYSDGYSDHFPVIIYFTK